jgi:ATPase subunit of ABC transporter with duplicated ATPase domains
LPGDLELVDDDWALEERLAAELHRLGLGHLDYGRRTATLSGGEATRLALAALFLAGHDLLILDEPTNNLDRGSRQALYAALAGWRGGLLVISHDRELLGMMDRIAELGPHGLRLYGGDYGFYAEQRELEREAARRDLTEAGKALRKTRREAQETRERQERRSSRGKKNRDKVGMPTIMLNMMRETSERTTARLGDAMQEKLGDAREALAEARERAAERRELDIDLSPVELPAGKTVLELDGVCYRHPGGPPLLEGLTLRLVGPERVALLGPNGSGKSTLLRLILGQLRPDAGAVRLGVERVSCLDQQTSLLDPRRSVLDNFRAWNPGLPETVCRLTLARFLFRTDAVHQAAGSLSGGERLRAGLACVLTAPAPPQLLLLDEPTNHLDLQSLENLEQALRRYTGALLVVSHDRTFLDNIGVGRRVELRPG